MGEIVSEKLNLEDYFYLSIFLLFPTLGFYLGGFDGLVGGIIIYFVLLVFGLIVNGIVLVAFSPLILILALFDKFKRDIRKKKWIQRDSERMKRLEREQKEICEGEKKLETEFLNDEITIEEYRTLLIELWKSNDWMKTFQPVREGDKIVELNFDIEEAKVEKNISRIISRKEYELEIREINESFKDGRITEEEFNEQILLAFKRNIDRINQVFD